MDSNTIKSLETVKIVDIGTKEKIFIGLTAVGAIVLWKSGIIKFIIVDHNRLRNSKVLLANGAIIPKGESVDQKKGDCILVRLKDGDYYIQTTLHQLNKDIKNIDIDVIFAADSNVRFSLDLSNTKKYQSEYLPDYISSVEEALVFIKLKIPPGSESILTYALGENDFQEPQTNTEVYLLDIKALQQEKGPFGIIESTKFEYYKPKFENYKLSMRRSHEKIGNHTAPTEEGLSGAPLVTKSGKIVGQNIGKQGTKALYMKPPKGIYYMSP